MKRNSSLRRRSVVTVEVLFVLLILAASFLSLADPACRDRTLHLTADGIAVGLVSATIQLLMLLKARLAPFTVGGVWNLSGVLVRHHTLYGIAAGYCYAVSLAMVECVTPVVVRWLLG